MSHEESFSRRQAESLLQAAAREPSARQRSITRAELIEAAAEAGIDPAKLEAEIRRFRRTPRALHVAVIALLMAGLAGALVLGAAWTDRPDPHLVSMHNEHRRQGFQLEVLVPDARARDSTRCGDPPTSRVIARDYCRLTRAWLAPGARLKLKLPDAPRGCPQVWVRAIDGPRSTAALFTLPANIEIERSGRLDQKGLGSPHMHAAPDVNSDHAEDCARRLEAGDERARASR